MCSGILKLSMTLLTISDSSFIWVCFLVYEDNKDVNSPMTIPMKIVPTKTMTKATAFSVSVTGNSSLPTSVRTP